MVLISKILSPILITERDCLARLSNLFLSIYSNFVRLSLYWSIKEQCLLFTLLKAMCRSPWRYWQNLFMGLGTGMVSIPFFYSIYCTWVGQTFFSKERNVLAFFCALYKKMFRSLRSFPFFIKERSILCVLFRSL